MMMTGTVPYIIDLGVIVELIGSMKTILEGKMKRLEEPEKREEEEAFCWRLIEKQLLQKARKAKNEQEEAFEKRAIEKYD